MNIARALAILPLVLATGCILPPPGSGPYNNSSPSSSSATGASGPTSQPASPSASSSAPAAAPVPTSVELHNDCANTVPLFFGSGDGKPGFSSGTKTSIGSNTTSSFPRNPDGTVTIWIIDDSENGVTSLKVTPSITRVSVNCTTLSPG